MARTRPRTLEEECPVCGALVGAKCTNYKGQGKAPCGVPLLTEGKPFLKDAEGKTWHQTLLFPNNAGQEGSQRRRR